MNDTCICENVPKVWRLTGVTRTLRLRIFNPDGTPLDLTGREVAVTIARDNSEFVYSPGFVIEGDDGNVVKFEWPADQQGAGDYTINVTTTDGSGNVDRVNWHGPTGIRLVDFSFMVRGEDALGVTSEANIGLDGTFTMNGVGMSAYDEWLSSPESEGWPQTVSGFMAYLKQPATDAAAALEQVVNEKMDEVDETMDEVQEQADADHTRAESDHARAESDHTTAASDHTTAANDHQQAEADHTRAEDDHTTAAADHTTAAADHTQATADHAVMAGYDTRLGDVEGEVSQLGQEVGKIICQGQTTVSRYHTLRANRTYTVRLSKADWSVTDVSDTIFLIRFYKANNTTTDVVRISKSSEATRVLEYYFTASASAIRYEILFRGNVGEEIYYYITDAGEPSLKLSPAFGNYTLFFDNANGKVIVKDGSMNFPRIGEDTISANSYKGIPQNTQISYGFTSSSKYYSLFADIVNCTLVLGGSTDNPQKTFGLLLIALLHTSDYSTVDWVLTNCHHQISDAGTSEDDLAIQAFLGKTATLYGSKYITNDGTVANASSWSTYMFDVVPGEVYKVESWFNIIGSSDSTKKQWVIVSKKLAVGESFTSGEIVSAGDSFGGSVIGKQFGSGYVVDKVTVPPGGKTLLVMKGDGETDAPAIERILPGQEIRIDKSVIKIKNGKPKPVTFIKPGFGILNFTSCSKSTGTETIAFWVGYFYKSPSFVFGGVNHYRNQQWRVPCIEGQFLSIRPSSNGTVTIKDFSGVFSSAKTWTGAGMRLDAHLGFQTVAPENSAVAFELAAICGYPACIVNPIASADGTLYCYHEDDNVLSYGGVRTSLSAASFALKTDAELEDYTVIGSSALAGLYGEPIPTLQEFFEICGRTGMRPMFSTHPALTATQWNEVKAMLLKYGLLKWFTVKSFDISILETAYGVFGDEIDGYIYDVSTNNVDGHIQAIQESEIANAKRIGIEYPENVITHEICERVISEGYFASIWSVGLITGQRYYDLAEMGVSEITDDNNGSCGLNY